MTHSKKRNQPAIEGIFRFFNFAIELIGWCLIAASPLLIGLSIAAFIYFPNPTVIRLVLAIVIAVTGLLTGIIWATKQWKAKGTVWFMSRTMATPELDNLEKESMDENSK